MITTLKKGFTLIELLVVITIIGILATGAVTVYTSQIQKARDTTRISDIKALQGAIEQSYQDQGQYPDKGGLTAADGITDYMQRFPEDPKSGQASTTAFEYLYNSSQDSNTIARQEYEVSTTFEQAGNITTKAADAADRWNDAVRFEAGVNVDDTEQNTTRSGAIPGSGVTDDCINPTTGWVGATCNASNPTLIRTN